MRQDDVTAVASDLLLLKFAQAFYGADQAVASKLVAHRVCTLNDLQPAPGDAVTLETRGAIAPTRVMFLGVQRLVQFGYEEMELFARTAVEKIAASGLPAGSLTTTVHGAGYGLDAGESLQRLVRGFLTGVTAQSRPVIQNITFLTRSSREARMLVTVLNSMADARPTLEPRVNAHRGDVTRPPAPASSSEIETAVDVRPALPASAAAKRKVFVAMPFSEEFQNVYEFGIYPAVRNCGWICERVDETHFAGDVLQHIKGGIEGADLVVADLTEGRPNVYLEVGYAWGRGVPVIFVAKKGEQLHFDVSTHRCIFYGAFSKFSQELEKLLKGIGVARSD